MGETEDMAEGETQQGWQVISLPARSPVVTPPCLSQAEALCEAPPASDTSYEFDKYAHLHEYRYTTEIHHRYFKYAQIHATRCY